MIFQIFHIHWGGNSSWAPGCLAGTVGSPGLRRNGSGHEHERFMNDASGRITCKGAKRKSVNLRWEEGAGGEMSLRWADTIDERLG